MKQQSFCSRTALLIKNAADALDSNEDGNLDEVHDFLAECDKLLHSMMIDVNEEINRVESNIEEEAKRIE